eukprot:1957885-Amphidinium_carterae.1
MNHTKKYKTSLDATQLLQMQGCHKSRVEMQILKHVDPIQYNMLVPNVGKMLQGVYGLAWNFQFDDLRSKH